MGKSKKSEKKSKKKHKKRDKYKHKKSKKSSKDRSEEGASTSKAAQEPTREATPPAPQEEEDFAIPVNLMNSKSHAPQTAEEYQKRQSYIRRETDPTTGRVRLIKGDGEVLEEIVTKARHQDINKSATKADGAYFAEKTVGKRKRS